MFSASKANSAGAAAIFLICHQTRSSSTSEEEKIHAEFNPIVNQKIRDGFTQIRRQYSHLSMEEFDPIFTTVSGLCVEHERLTFLEGLRLGMTLMMELAEEKSA